MKKLLALAVVALVSVVYSYAQEWQPYYVIEEVGQEETAMYWFQIDWKNKLFFLDSDSEDETKGVMKNYKESGTKKSFDVYYAVGSGYENEMLCSIVFDKEEGEDKYSITRTMEGSTHKQKFIVSTKKPVDVSNPEDVLKGGGSPKDAIKDGVNKALNKINVFKKKK